jgi:signal transduction histidine kinase
MIRTSAVAGAWLPMLAMWVVLSMAYGQLSFAAALPRASATVAVAAILGLGVWHFCARMPWPHELRIRFYALHLAAATLYSVLWLACLFASEPLLTGTPIREAFRSARATGWWVVLGLCLYGVVAGVSYAIQTQRRAHENERRALRAEAGLSAARLDALQNRLHPHFLFNALHTVSALVREDSARAETAIEQLGDMLRYSLQEPASQTVPFAEEWEFTRRYLDFEQLRYGERLRVRTAIEPDCMGCTTPAFTLQTLVENAVHHSIATRAEGGRIEILARASGERLFLRVRDDGGTGLPAARTGAQFGLQALRERLTAVYGADSQLAVESRPGHFEVSLTVPRRRSEDADEE